MEGWHRDMTFADTGMPWVLPSPHIPTTDAALLYPATGIMGELDYVSIGVGYTLPFSLTGAPWIDATALSDRLNAIGLDGVEFRPIYFKPFYTMFKGENLGGIQIYVRERATAPLSIIQFYIMQELAALYPNHKAFTSAQASRLKMFDQVCGSPEVRRLFSTHYKVADMKEFWDKDASRFKEASTKYYLYQ